MDASRTVHLVGIGGVGMAGLAVLLKRRGWQVSGCDLKPTPRTRWLERLAVTVSYGHDPAHVANADAVIVTPAVAKDNPEYLAAKARPRCESRGAVLADLVSRADDAIAVCGSHGKTTTATFVAKLLIALGESVEWAIGGETGSFPVAGFRAGTATHASPCGTEGAGVLVVEADESDGTLALYHAKTLVVTNCEYDHPDHFKTFADYVACYDAARRNAGAVIEGAAIAGTGGGAAVAHGDAEDQARLAAILAPLAAHNRQNALVAIEVARRRGHSLAAILAVLPETISALPDRRFQPLYRSAAFAVYTDYGHHPTEMRCAVQMARAVCRGRLRVLFQPHRYSRTRALMGDFPAAFEGADEVVLCPVYAAFEPPLEGGSSADLYAACRGGGEGAPAGVVRCASARYYLARSCDEAWVHARNAMRPGDVTLILGAGDIIALASRARELAQVERGRPFPHAKLWLGQGSNTWQSDLKLDVDYVKSSSPAGRPGAALLREHPDLIPWMAGIPGTVGGWVKMNAGAFGHSISEVLESVKVDGVWRDAADCGFGYRTSKIEGEIQDIRLKPTNRIIDESTNQTILTPTDFLARRKAFPAGTKGSVFKNPPSDFAGRLLEAVGARALRVGGAYVWAEHANVIVAGPGASPSDFLALAELMQARVFFTFGIRLEPEVQGLA